MKKGFTLIELLAVIVILAIIALIATPIVLNIIDETKESASLRSAEMYLDAVEQGIARSMLQNKYITDGTYNITKDGDICLENFDSTNKTCPDINTLKVEVDGEKPDGGTITIENGNIKNITLNLDNKTIGNGVNGEMVYDLPSTLCKRIEGPAKEIGTKYQCKVKDDMEEGFEDGYYFYVLSIEDDNSLNLILDRNVCADGTPTDATKSDKCLVEWNSSGNNANGPVTAMTYLNNATSTWSNLENLNITYNDEGNHFTNFQITGKARLPRYDEVKGNGKCSTSSGSCPLYLVNYLTNSSYVTGEGLVNISGIYGYWTLSSNANLSYSARDVSYVGYVSYFDVDSELYDGVRPVINLKL